MNKKKLGTSPITGTIFLGRTKKNKGGVEEWSGEKHDVTDNAIASVFEHMMHMAKFNSKDGFYSYTFGELGTMSFELKAKK
jgi:hypothetical protein